MANTQRKCPYKNCKYGNVVDISTDEYTKVGSRYYHSECLLEKGHLKRREIAVIHTVSMAVLLTHRPMNTSKRIRDVTMSIVIQRRKP